MIGLLSIIGVWILIWWFAGPSAKIDQPITVNIDATVMTIGNLFILLNLHSVSALWASSGLGINLLGMVIFECICKNHIISHLYFQIKHKLNNAFVRIVDMKLLGHEVVGK